MDTLFAAVDLSTIAAFILASGAIAIAVALNWKGIGISQKAIRTVK